MKILLLGRLLPPPRRPVRGTREYQFARHLARTHQVTLAFVADNPDAIGVISALRSEFGDLEFASIPRGWKTLSSAVRSIAGDSCTLSYFRSEALRTRLADRLRETRYDVVLVSSSGMIPYALDIDPTIPLVADFAEVDSVWWEQYSARGGVTGAKFFATEMTRLRLAEAALARRAASCIVESPEAAAIIRGLAPGASISVIRSGVDIEQFAACPGPGNGPTVVFSTSLGESYGFADAVTFCRTVVPLLRARAPKLRIVIASRDSVLFGERSEMTGVEAIAPVVDLRLLFHGEAVAVAPLRAGLDVRSSVLEPMAAGVPVVATGRVAKHLAMAEGSALSLAEDPAEFAREVADLLKDPERRAALGGRGRAYVIAEQGWSVMARKMQAIVEGVTRSASPTIETPGPSAAAVPIVAATRVANHGDAR